MYNIVSVGHLRIREHSGSLSRTVYARRFNSNIYFHFPVVWIMHFNCI